MRSSIALLMMALCTLPAQLRAEASLAAYPVMQTRVAGIEMRWLKDMPDYWRVLTEAVPPAKGLPHFRKIRISGLKSTGAQRAFAVSSYADSPLVDFQFKDIEIEAKTAGTIANAQGWKMENMRIKTADGSTVTVK